jgi:hypothetical protein
MIVLARLTQLAAGWQTASAILAQDEAKDRLIESLSKRRGDARQAAGAFLNANSLEVAHSLETYFAIDSSDVVNHLPALPSFYGLESSFRIGNFIEGPWTNFDDLRRVRFGFDASFITPKS